ncbi:MAG: 3-phosphoserine/phosphohydroxythreonine transaminase [Myxococcales bacterium]|nr:MAG: 3-phosphoserine/phosphohydroxythreonine transaminase [Myxococcales bacterium]
MPERIYNFSAGPSMLPLPVLKKAQAEFVNYADSGMSLFEMSHRGKIYDAVHNDAVRLTHEVYGIPTDTHQILFIQGGATLQFAMIPMSFLGQGKFAEYVTTGTWSQKALKDAQLIGDAREIATGKAENFMAIPKKFTVNPSAEYLHITTNNTIKGTEWHKLPDAGKVPIFADMSSDFLSRRVDWAKIGLAYGGVQKNLAPAGMALVIIRKDVLAKASQTVPAYLRYDLHAGENSLYNTPPVFPIYMMKLVLEWVKEVGGLEQMDKWAQQRSDLLYNAIDASGGYYKGPCAKEDRSRMNICWRLPTEELEAKFIAEASKKQLSGLKGHRSVGGCRASVYNAMPIEGVQALVKFMEEFKKANPA